MPTAEELRLLTQSYNAEEDFIQIATRLIEAAARTGQTIETIEVPDDFTCEQAKKILNSNFPNCRITKVWFVKCFKVSWAK